MKFLVPVARQSVEDCQRMAAIFADHLRQEAWQANGWFWPRRVASCQTNF
jgi:hypothetical protein